LAEDGKDSKITRGRMEKMSTWMEKTNAAAMLN
jgi:hypothetical protein